MSNYELRHVVQQDEGSAARAAVSVTAGSQIEEEVVLVGSRERKLDHPGKPIDKYKMVFFILFLHGVGTLMPWNMFINAQDYFRKFKLTPGDNVDPNSMDIIPADLDRLREYFLPYLGLASQVPNLIFNGLNLLVNMGSGNLKLRVNLTLLLEALIFMVTIILAVVDSSRRPGAFFYATMISVIILNMASGIYQNCIFGTGAKFPGNYTNAILIGSNFSGTFTSTINLLSIWLAPKPQEAAMYYFITALFVIVTCIISYNMLPLNPFFRHFDQASSIETNESQLGISSTTNGTNKGSNCINEDIPDSVQRTVDAMVPRASSAADQQGGLQQVSYGDELKRKWLVFKQCWPQCVNVFLTFYVTLALFPSILADIRAKQNYIGDKKYFAPFACFFLFNLFAMLGNLISGCTTWPGRSGVWIMVVARFLFVPFFLFCNYSPDQRKWPVLIESDLVYMSANVLFALSSGYLSSLCMMFASDNLKSEDASTGGMLAAFFLVFGIFAGINSSFLLKWIVH